MSNEKLKELLTAVHDEMEGTEADDETRSMLKSLTETIVWRNSQKRNSSPYGKWR